MAKRTFLVDIDLNKNQLINAKIHNLSTAPTLSASDIGYVYYDTATKHTYVWDGSGWLQIQDSNVASQIHASSAKATPHDNDEIGIVDTEASNALKKLTWSANKSALKTYFDTLYSPVGGLNYKGGYDSSTNSPDLDTAPSGVKKGDTYTVTVAGTSFTEAVQVGDMIIAEKDDASALADWTIVNKNIPDIVDASESAKGIIQLATTAEANAGSDNAKAITPAKLAGYLSNGAYTKKYSADVGDGTNTSYTITHNLGTRDVVVSVQAKSDYHVVECEVIATTTSAVILNFNVAPTNNQYRVTIVA